MLDYRAIADGGDPLPGGMAGSGATEVAVAVAGGLPGSTTTRVGVNAQEVSYFVRSPKRRDDDTDGRSKCKRENDEEISRS
jgi:hypothetical protein